MLRRIYRVREARVAAAVRKLLEPVPTTSTILDALLRYLNYSKDPEGPPAVKKLLANSDLKGDSRAVCAAYLLAMGESSHAKDLATALRDGEVRSYTRLNSFLSQAPHLDNEILAAILKFVEDNLAEATQLTQVTYALKTLAKHRYRKALRVIREMLESDEPRLSKAAFDALLQMGDELEPKSLRKLLDPERPELCIVAADALRRLDDMSGLQPLLAVVKKDGSTRSDAIAALGKFRVRAAVRPLIDALNDSNATVRSRAYQGLRTVLKALFPYRRLDLASTGYAAHRSAAHSRHCHLESHSESIQASPSPTRSSSTTSSSSKRTTRPWSSTCPGPGPGGPSRAASSRRATSETTSSPTTKTPRISARSQNPTTTSRPS